MPQLPGYSGTPISSLDTLEQNIVENGTALFCSSSFLAGSYAISGTLLGAPPLEIPAALLTTGAVLASLALCPNNASQDNLFGTPPPFNGGQCVANYNFDVLRSYTDPFGCNAVVDSQHFDNIAGPIGYETRIDVPDAYYPCKGQSYNVLRSSVKNRFGNVITYGDYAEGLPNDFVRLQNIVRSDGQPDNCGNLPNTGGQIITNVNNGDTINNDTVVDNSSITYVAPVTWNLGGINGTVNFELGGIHIGSLFPLSFQFNYGGVRILLEPGPDKKLRPVPTNPDPTQPGTGADEYKKILDELKKIEDCVCKAPVELDMLFLPRLAEGDSCGIATDTFLVPKGSVSEQTVTAFVDSANQAVIACKAKSPEQLDPLLIFGGSTGDGSESIYSPLIDTEIYSVVVKITANENASLSPITTFGKADQFKYGSVAFSTEWSVGSGDYLYLFDKNTYWVLPRRAKKGKIRLLLREFLSYEVWDSGERI